MIHHHHSINRNNNILHQHNNRNHRYNNHTANKVHHHHNINRNKNILHQNNNQNSNNNKQQQHYQQEEKPPQQQLQQQQQQQHHQQQEKTSQQQQQQQSTTVQQQESGPILIYPQGKGGLALYQWDIARLEGCSYLNDTLINVCCAWTVDELGATATIRVVDFQWYNQATKGPDSTALCHDQLQQNAQRLRRWFPQGHPFDKALVIIPVCVRQHWVMAVVIQLEDKVVISVLDSLASAIGTQVQQNMLTLLKFYRPSANASTLSLATIHRKSLYDCGLHVIRNSVKVMTHEDSRLHRMPNGRKEMDKWQNNCTTTISRFVTQRFRG